MNISVYIFSGMVLPIFFLLPGCSIFTDHESIIYSESPQFNNNTKRFQNSNGISNSKSTFEIMSFVSDFLNRANDPVEKFGLPLLDPKSQKNSPIGRQIVWIGHSTLLLTIDGVTILTDPIFSPRASPFSPFGPKRVVPPSLEIKDLPKIDAVIISHNHYDHLDLESLKKINRIQPEIRYFVPLGLKSILINSGILRVKELDWWDSASFAGLKFTSTPVRHWSSRSFFDRNKTLWTGWMVEWPKYRFYFAGDTGYSNDFIETRLRLGSPDLAAIPIGSYEPRNFMKQSHINPEESVRVFEDLSAKQAVSIHWGTFKLTTELLDEPPKRLLAEIKRRGINPKKFLSLIHGQKLLLD